MKNIINHPIFTRGLILPKNSIHGFYHWWRVEKLGIMIANHNEADKKVIRLFAYLHDARRKNELIDPAHGKRAVKLLDELVKAKVININNQQYTQLKTALFWHNRHLASSDNITVQTCWDADRLDLWRLDIIPNPKRMFTICGKSKKMIIFAKALNHK